MPTFHDSENIVPMVPEGDYVFRVVEFTQGISKGGKTAGCARYELKCAIELPDGKPGPNFYENLIDHASTAWKIDTFLKSAGIALPKGESFEFAFDDAADRGVRHVEPVGLRGWCNLAVEEYPVGSGKKRNRVATFYTNKPKLAPVIAPKIDDADVPFGE